ncbi:hypothetical protein Dimus_014922 [Dionaea muscipula]
MASITVTPIFESSGTRDGSFPSYINGAVETFLQKQAVSSQNLLPDTPAISEQKAENGEIGVFRADKYFNGGVDIEKNMRNIKSGGRRSYHHSKTDEDTGSNTGQTVELHTPSIHSQSSRGSQSSLLRTIKINKLQQGKRFFANLGCHCSCNDKKSVEIDDHLSSEYSNSKTTRTRSTEALDDTHEDLDEAGITRSLTPPPPERTKMVNNMPAWDAIPRVEDIGIQVPSVKNQDTESEASSDLFEIDCLLSYMATPALPHQQPDKEDHLQKTASNQAKIMLSTMTKSPGKINDEQQKSHPVGILSGCRSEKAVRVASGDTFRNPGRVKSDPEKYRRPEPSTPMKVSSKE